MWDRYYGAFLKLSARIHAASPGTYAEFVIPELITEEVEQIDLTTEANKVIAARIKKKTGVVLPARFVFAQIRQDKPQYGAKQLPDYVWSCHFQRDEGGCEADVFVKNGIPSLSKAQGKAWVLYLAARAFDAGADAIYIVPSRDLASANPWRDFADVVAKIRALKPNVIIGSQQLNAFPAAPSGFVPRNHVDFIKTMIDVDIYKTDAQGRRTVAPSHLDTARVPCYVLGDAANALYLPNNADENLCIVQNRVGRRPIVAAQKQYGGDNVIENNRFGLPILLEYDPSGTTCSAPVFLPKAHPDLMTDCTRAGIRHGMSVSTIFPMSTGAVRRRYIQYSYRLGRRLTRTRGFPVYVFGWLSYGEKLEIRDVWELAVNDLRYAAQTHLVRMTPANKADANGVLQAPGCSPDTNPGCLPPEKYIVSRAPGDLAELTRAIEAVTAATTSID